MPRHCPPCDGLCNEGRLCPARAPAEPAPAPLRVTITLTDAPDGRVAITSSPDLRTLLDLHEHGSHATSALVYALAAWVGMDALSMRSAGRPCITDPRLEAYAAQLLRPALTPTHPA